MSTYYGSLEDPRYSIDWHGGTRIFGWILSDGKGDPVLNENFHVWRWCDPVGWCHIAEILDRSPIYLQKTIDSLWEQKLVEKYGRKAVIRMKEAKAEAAMEKEAQQKAQAFEDLQKENKGMLRTIAENFAAGKVRPTNQVVETITSYNNQSNRSRIIRPSEDSDGGLVDWSGKAGKVK